MAFFEMDCLGGHAEIVTFSDCFATYGHLIEEESVVFVRGNPSETSDFSDLTSVGSSLELSISVDASSSLGAYTLA